MVDPDKIIKGEEEHTLEEFYNELKSLMYQVEGIDDGKKEQGFHSLFMFIMLSAEDKPVEMMMEIFGFTKEQIVDQQETFKDYIDTCRAIHMRKFLDIYSEYLAGTSMTLRMLNLWVTEFLSKHIREEKHGAA